MMILSKKIKRAVERLTALPGIGPRQAIRLAFHLSRSGSSNLDVTAAALRDLGELKVCPHCFFIHEHENDIASNDELCAICSDPNRSADLIAVVEKETDLLSLEGTNRFSGRYLVLGDLKKNGVLGPEERRRLDLFKNRLQATPPGRVTEIVIALNPTSFGDFNASVLEKELSNYADRVTRLGRGLPTGGEIEFADAATLEQALNNRS